MMSSHAHVIKAIRDEDALDLYVPESRMKGGIMTVKDLQCRALTASVALIFTTLFVSSAQAGNIVSTPVGFARIEVSANCRVAASLPFLPFNESIHAIFAGQVDGPTNPVGSVKLLKWDAAMQEYVSAIAMHGTGDPAIDGIWFSDHESGVLSEMTLLPGEGFWLENHTGESRDFFFCGQVVLDETLGMGFEPGLNLFGYPYASNLELAGDAGRLPPDSADTLSAYRQGEFVFAQRGDDDSLHWNVPEEGPLLLRMGSGYFYVRNEPEVLAWDLSRPYADPFPVSGSPQVTAIHPYRSGRAMTLRLESEGIGESLEILWKDIAPDQALNTAAGWRVADRLAPLQWDYAGKRTETTPSASWTDYGACCGGRPDVNRVFARLYLAARADIDTDGDGITDAREIFIHGTDLDNPDTDGDGMPDGWELAHGLDPCKNDALSDEDEDGKTNLAEHLAGTDPRYARHENVTIHVDCTTGNDAFDGSSECVRGNQGPKKTIAAALGSAIPGDTVIVHEGTYKEDVDIRGKGVRFRIAGDVRL